MLGWWEGKQDEKAACLSTDVDEEERSAQISSAHSQGGRCQAVQEGRVLGDAGVCFPLAEEEEGYCGEGRQGGGERRLIGLGKGGGGEH